MPDTYDALPVQQVASSAEESPVRNVDRKRSLRFEAALKVSSNRLHHLSEYIHRWQKPARQPLPRRICADRGLWLSKEVALLGIHAKLGAAKYARQYDDG